MSSTRATEPRGESPLPSLRTDPSERAAGWSEPLREPSRRAGSSTTRPRTSAFARALNESAADCFLRRVVHPGRSGTRETQGGDGDEHGGHAAAARVHGATRRAEHHTERRAASKRHLSAAQAGQAPRFALRHRAPSSQTLSSRLSQRLVFFSLAEDGGQAWECIAKDRDGHLTAVHWSSPSSSNSPACAGASSPFLERGQAEHGVAALRERGGGGGRRGRVWRRRRRGHCGEPAETPADADVPIVQWKHSGNHVRQTTRRATSTLSLGSSRRTESSGCSSGAGVLDVAGGAGGTSFEPPSAAACRARSSTRGRSRPPQSRAARCAAARRCPRRARRRPAARRRRRGRGVRGGRKERSRRRPRPPTRAPPFAPAGEVAPVAPGAGARGGRRPGLAAGSTCLPSPAARALRRRFCRAPRAAVARLLRRDRHAPRRGDRARRRARAGGGQAVCRRAVLRLPESNPHRVCADGTPVRLHPEYCRYLEERGRALAAPAASLAVEATTLWKLPGRNAVVYALPKGQG